MIQPNTGSDIGPLLRAHAGQPPVELGPGTFKFSGTLEGVRIHGAGSKWTKLVNVDANGQAGFAITVGDAGLETALKGFRLESAGVPDIQRSRVQPTCRDGILVGSTAIVEDVTVNKFRYGVGHNGNHAYLRNVYSSGNWAGLARLPGKSDGDTTLDHCFFEGNRFCSFYVHQDARLTGLRVVNITHAGLSPHVFFKQDGGLVPQLATGLELMGLRAEDYGHQFFGCSDGKATLDYVTFDVAASSRSYFRNYQALGEMTSGSVYLKDMSNVRVLGHGNPFEVGDTCVLDVERISHCPDLGDYSWHARGPLVGKTFCGPRLISAKKAFYRGLDQVLTPVA